MFSTDHIKCESVANGGSVVNTYIYGAQYNVFGGWNFAGQNLTNVSFYLATLPGAEFTNAQIRGAVFSWVTSYGFPAFQHYSTASYQAHDSSGMHAANCQIVT
jgi:uncharacterized protein YjbI with pentapeptide repeats